MRVVQFLASAAIVASGCQQQDATSQAGAPNHPLAGLYTPGSQLGVTNEVRNAIIAEQAMAAAGTSGGSSVQELQNAIMNAADSDHCVGATGAAGTPGSLSVEFTTAGYGGKYTPTNCGAVWIEDPAGTYIATPAIWARIRVRPLFFWQSLRCSADTPDAITSPTLDQHRMHSITWDGLDLKGNQVPDGMYVVNIEVTEDEANVGRRAQFPFMKGPTPETQTPADTECVKGLKLVYTPDTDATPPTGGT